MPQPVILYDEAPASGFESPVPSARLYVVVYQNDADPNATQGVIDPARVVLRVRKIFRDELRSDWGVLDFEEPYDAILAAGPSHPGYRAAVDSMVATIRRVKEVVPNTRWTYYASPRLPYWIGTDSWGSISAERRAREYDRILDNYAEILREQDWFLPCGYDLYERALGMPVGTDAERDAAETGYRRAGVEIVRRWFERERVSPRPIVPILSPWFQPGGKAAVPKTIPPAEFLADQVLPVVDAGADGIALWGAMTYHMRRACAADPAPNASGRAEQRELRAVLAEDLLDGADPGSVAWSSLQVRGELGRRVNAALKRALSMVDQTFRVRRKSGVGPEMPAPAPSAPRTQPEPETAPAGAPKDRQP